MKFRNPVIPGCNPDPSICRVGDDFYLVVSSFEFFPGIPVYHSKNLVEWELAGHCLNEDSKLNLVGCPPSGGLYAPSVQYHEGLYFLTCTNVSDKGNFIIYTKDILGDWSEPVWVDQKGIDPSLFFDDDGKVYFLTAFGEVYISEIDPFTGERKTDVQVFNRGCGGKNPEAPHIFKKEGKYYLLLAEGGTEYGHMETIQRADSVLGPYEPCPHNPLIKNKDQTEINIHCTGHGELVCDQNGNWWMVCLGVRTLSDFYLNRLLHNLGREVFLAPVRWNEEGWPEVGERGLIEYEMEGELPGSLSGTVCHDFTDDFSEAEFDRQYQFIRNPVRACYKRDTAGKRLLLYGTDVTLNQTDSPVFAGVRQKSFDIDASVCVSGVSGKNEMRLGLTAYYNEFYHYEIYLTEKENRKIVAVSKHIHDIQITASEEELLFNADQIWMRIIGDKWNYRFLYSTDGIEYKEIAVGVTAGLCTETTMNMTYTGVFIGVFAEKGTGSFKNFQVINRS